MKNFHKIRKKREFLFDDKELYALGFLTIIILLLMFTLGFMVGQTLEEQSVASTLNPNSDSIPDNEFGVVNEDVAPGALQATENPGTEDSMTAGKNNKTFQRSSYRVLSNSGDMNVEVEVTPAGKVLADEPIPPKATEIVAQAKQAKEAPAQTVKEDTPVPPEVAPVVPPANQTASTVPALPNVPKNPDDEFRFRRKASTSGTKTPLSGMLYSVQVASSPSREDSERLQQKYGQFGYLAYVITADLGEKGTWYRVRVGNLQTNAEAEALKEEIMQKFPKLANNPFIIKVTEE